MVSLRSAIPPPAAAVQQWILTEYAELRPLRTALRHALDAPGLGPDQELDDVAEHLTIVATELATNALRHAGSPATVRLSRTNTAFILDVADDLPSTPPIMLEGRPSGAGGRGLHITQDLALDTGWYLADGSKHVWAQFAIPRRLRRAPSPRISVFDLTTFIRLLRRMRT